MSSMDFKKLLKFILNLSLVLVLSFNFSSCSLKAIPSEIPYVILDKNSVNLNSLGNGKILFYNYGYYCPTIECGRTTKLNIKINGRSLGQINYGEFFIVEIENGEYEFQLMHKDVINIKSTIKVVIDEKTKIIQAIPRPLSNSIKITNEIPAEFHNFVQVR